MAILLALIPIMMIFICLFLFKQTSLRSSLISYAVCVGIVLLSPTFQLGISETVHATIKGWLICFIVGYVLFFGIFLFHLMNKMGYIDQVARFLEEVTHDRLLQMLLMCFGICPLIESVSGFGIGFMVAAPIFLSLGYKPFQAVLLSFIGLLASSWGAMATGYNYRFAAYKHAAYNTWHKYSTIKHSDVCLFRHSVFTRCWWLAGCD